MALTAEHGSRAPQEPGGQPPKRFRDSFNDFMNRRTHGNWNHEDPRIRKKTRRTVYALGIFSAAVGGLSLGVGLDAAITDPQVASTPPATDPNPAYTGPADHCWTAYDNAVTQANTPGGSISPAEAQTLFDCTNENPGYFGQQTVPVSDGSSAVIGDRPLK